MRRYARQASGLVRRLRWWDVLVITISAPTGSGILYYAVRTSGQPGGSIAIAFLAGMFLFLPFVLSSLFLVSSMPRSGGPYVAISRLVHPALGYLSATLLVFGDSLIVGVLGFLLMQIAGGMLAAVGQAHQLHGVVHFGDAVQGPWGSVSGGIAWVVAFWFLMLQSPKYFRWVLGIMLLIPLLASIASVLAFVGDSGGHAQAAFDSLWGPESWSRIFNAAREHGWKPTPFSFSDTSQLLLVVIWAFNGIEIASYAGGEVQSPSSSYWRGLLLGWFAVGALYLMIAFSVHHAFGEFLGAYDFLFSKNKEVLAQIMPALAPSIPFYLMCLWHSPVMGLVFGLAFVLWFAKIIPAAYLTTSRLMFALAMDRLLPEAVADVNPRTTAPTWATHITAVLALAGVMLYFLQVETVLGTLMFCTMFIAWPTGLATFLLARKHPELVPVEWPKRKVVGLPLLSWLGLVTVGIGLFLLYLTLRGVSGGVLATLAVVVALLMFQYRARVKITEREEFVGEVPLLPPE